MPLPKSFLALDFSSVKSISLTLKRKFLYLFDTCCVTGSFPNPLSNMQTLFLSSSFLVLTLTQWLTVACQNDQLIYFKSFSQTGLKTNPPFPYCVKTLTQDNMMLSGRGNVLKYWKTVEQWDFFTFFIIFLCCKFKFSLCPMHAISALPNQHDRRHVEYTFLVRFGSNC